MSVMPFFRKIRHTDKSVNILEPKKNRSDAQLQKCLNCENLCLHCIKDLCGLTGKPEASSYRLLYVTDGNIQLRLPIHNVARRLTKGELILIPDQLTFAVESENNCAASFLVKNVSTVPDKSVSSKKLRFKCSYKRSCAS
ncbi:MAG TPA: hypothetical protein PKA28_09695 [Methylomusa anaerophila]|uniref:Uncharacterized protein n=1 Tax=Methylomusa anaerophila TaxID=1930071 RepID=A0A348AHY4_9FIRM|nr:hypothetical protein [Methylomusa anaerophila]BBB90682.1 hypothetical protein MAMMFC1_01343 [Methylomusa anaerophila]HML88712.1 hypothetical protein [Methylomusa anaerophila]